MLMLLQTATISAAVVAAAAALPLLSLTVMISALSGWLSVSDSRKRSPIETRDNRLRMHRGRVR